VTEITTVRELIEALGGVKAVAELLRVGVPYTRTMLDAGLIPAKHQRAIANALPSEYQAAEALFHHRRKRREA